MRSGSGRSLESARFSSSSAVAIRIDLDGRRPRAGVGRRNPAFDRRRQPAVAIDHRRLQRVRDQTFIRPVLDPEQRTHPGDLRRQPPIPSIASQDYYGLDRSIEIGRAHV